ncbi:MAG: dephospho-CoA kinase [Alphaproteobacteria bacterium]|nr:dephospho-CoA kinase [Alphaproteobacteria bacterium]
MIVVGLTGSVGMGKSVTASMLMRLGVPVHDSDAEVHSLLSDKDTLADLKSLFPPSAYPRVYAGSPQGPIDRAALGEIIFKDPDKRRALESILHPRVRQAQTRFIRKHSKAGAGLVVLDIPLLFETGAQDRVDCVIVVSAPPHIQRARVLSRPGMTPERFEAILAAQMPDSEKRARADYVLETGLGRAHTMKRLMEILADIRHNISHRSSGNPPESAHEDRDDF